MPKVFNERGWSVAMNVPEAFHGEKLTRGVIEAEAVTIHAMCVHFLAEQTKAKHLLGLIKRPWRVALQSDQECHELILLIARPLVIEIMGRTTHGAELRFNGAKEGRVGLPEIVLDRVLEKVQEKGPRIVFVSGPANTRVFATVISRRTEQGRVADT